MALPRAGWRALPPLCSWPCRCQFGEPSDSPIFSSLERPWWPLFLPVFDTRHFICWSCSGSSDSNLTWLSPFGPLGSLSSSGVLPNLIARSFLILIFHWLNIFLSSFIFLSFLLLLTLYLRRKWQIQNYQKWGH